MPFLNTYSGGSIRGWRSPVDSSGQLEVISTIDISGGRHIYWNGSSYCLVGDNNLCYTSTDGIDWTQQTITLPTGVSGAQWFAVHWNGFWLAGGSVFYTAGGRGSAVAKSVDGINWTVYEVNAGFQINNIVYGGTGIGNDRWYAVYNVGGVVGGGVVTSLDGEDWVVDLEVRQTAFNALAYGDNSFLVGGGGVGVSGNSVFGLVPDYTGWRGRGSTPSNYVPQDAVIANGLAIMTLPGGRIATGASSVITGFVYTLVGNSNIEWDTITYIYGGANRRFVAIGDDQSDTYYTQSTDGYNWSTPAVLYPSSIFIGGAHSSVYNGDFMIAVSLEKLYVITV